MNYSFTKPNVKTLFKRVTKIWWGYIFLTLFIIVGFVGTLKMQEYFMNTKLQITLQEQKKAIEQIKSYQKSLETEQKTVEFAGYLAKHNALLEESVHNLFSMIPEQITLRKIEMNKEELTLYGTTPSKQIYTFLLEVPLRSVFHQSKADFYRLPNGWYNFVSISKLNREQ
ncbi:hypothetical protein B6S12_02800 [Helicobacter valdiviensis]|uniref:Uncharacterized protein n=1 Tax=Helicobacter valdiviensis TaxID=1458358 RepID=A0A2W6MXA0_9HELI|nr:hypothetical protein [Helicobacter valdiviensis]PZT48589.1 hypothetical protein B6S12_02800 [Helicobacter valdiviensis]